jgi:hypothetical protein
VNFARWQFIRNKYDEDYPGEKYLIDNCSPGTIVNVTLLVLVPVLRQGMNLVMMMGHMLVKLRGIIQTRKFRLTNSA